jgi:hypothetical protein
MTPERPCAHCKNLFKPRRGKDLTCSPECHRQRTLKRGRDRYYANADAINAACKIRYHTDPIYREKALTRSNAWNAKRRLENTPISELKNCMVCGAPFRDVNNGRKILCSKKCRNLHRRWARRLNAKPNRPQKIYSRDCAWCKTVFKTPNIAKFFCSKICNQRHRRNQPEYGPRTRSYRQSRRRAQRAIIKAALNLGLVNRAELPHNRHIIVKAIVQLGLVKVEEL